MDFFQIKNINNYKFQENYVNDFSKSQGFSLKKAVLYSTFKRTVLIIVDWWPDNLNKIHYHLPVYAGFPGKSDYKIWEPHWKTTLASWVPLLKIIIFIIFTINDTLGIKTLTRNWEGKTDLRLEFKFANSMIKMRLSYLYNSGISVDIPPLVIMLTLSSLMKDIDTNNN